MKILHILTDTNIGGAGRYLMALLASYNRSDFVMEVVLPEGSRLVPHIKALDVTVLEVPYIGDRSLSIKGIKVLYRLLGEREPDIVNTHASFSGRIAAKMKGIPAVYTRHYCVTKQRLNFLNNLLGDRVIATSPEVEAGLLATGTKAEFITSIYNGVPPLNRLSQEKKINIRKRYGIDFDTFVISQVARLDPIKGQDYTLDAAKLLTNDRDIVILLCGDGPSENHLRRRIKEESIENVIMTGFIEDVEEIFNISDLQINASFTETTCLALLEGMSLGIPAVATNGGGNPYVIIHGERGLIVPCGDGAAIGDAIVTIKKDPGLYQQLSTKALDGYNRHFRADTMARQVEGLYKALRK